MALSQRLRTRTRAPEAVTRSLSAASETPGRAKSQTDTVVSCARCKSCGSTGETAGRGAANPAGRNTIQKNRRIKTGTGDGGRGRRKASLHGFHLAKAHADDRRDTRLLHRDTVNGIGRLHRPRVVRDDDELCLILELRQQAHVAADVGVVQGGVHLVEQAERARLGEENGEQQRDRDEGALAGGQQVDALRPFAPRRRMDLDFAFQRLVFVRQTDIAFAAAEQRLEYGAEMLPDLGERIEEERFRRLIDLTRRLLQRIAGGHEIVALRLEELEALGLFRVLLDGQGVDGPDGVDGAAQPVVLLPQPLDVSRDLGRFGEQLVERLAPFGFDALHQPAFAPLDFGALELQPVLLLAQGGERLPRLIEGALGLAEIGVGHADIRLGVSGGGLELDQCQATLLRRVCPLLALRRERRRLALDPRDLRGASPRLFAGSRRLRVRATGALGGSGQARLDLRRLDLPAHALLACRFLLCFEVGEPRALGPELFGAAQALHLALLQLDVDRAEPRFDFSEAAREARDLRARFFGLAARMDEAPIGFPLFRTGFQLGVARLLGVLSRRRETRFRRRQFLHGRLLGRARAVEIALGVAHFLLQRFQLGAALERPGGRRAAVEEHGAVGAAQRAAPEDLVASEQGADPRRRGSVHPQLVLQRVAIGAEPRARDAGQ